MKCGTFLIKHSVFMCGDHAVSVRETPENITGADVRMIMALDTKDGFVKMSMETWKRVEFFMDILGGVDFTCYEMDVENLLNKYREMFDEQKIQPTVAGTGKGEMACTESSPAGEAAEAGLLSDVRGEAATGEAASPSL
jgi:hypothetical protein